MFYRITYETQPDPITVSKVFGYLDDGHLAVSHVPVYGHKAPQANEEGFHTFRLKEGEVYSLHVGEISESLIHVKGGQAVQVSYDQVINAIIQPGMEAAINAL